MHKFAIALLITTLASPVTAQSVFGSGGLGRDKM